MNEQKHSVHEILVIAVAAITMIGIFIKVIFF